MTAKPIYFYCSNERLVKWLNEQPRRDPALAFTAGKERELADWITVVINRDKDAATAELRAENEQLKSYLARIKSLCRTGKKLNKERDALTVIAGYCEEDETTNPERGE